MNDSVRSALSAFPETARFRSSDLMGLLETTDWRSIGAADGARARIRRHLDEAIAAGDALAVSLGAGRERLWRNLVACALKEHLGAYGLLLEHAGARGRQLLGPEQAGIRRRFPRRDKVTRALEGFLQASGPPSAAELAALVPNQRVACFRAEARELVQRVGAAARLPDYLLQRALRVFGKKRPDRALRHTAAFLAGLESLPRLTLKKKLSKSCHSGRKSRQKNATLASGVLCNALKNKESIGGGGDNHIAL